MLGRLSWHERGTGAAMRKAAKDPRLGALLQVDRPLAPWKGRTVIGLVAFVIGGWTLALPGPPWAFVIAGLALGVVAAMYILGERFLLEQRIHEHGLVSRSRIPFVGMYVLPYVAIDPRSIHITPRFRWDAPGEKHLPWGRCLRCLPFGPVVRFQGPDHSALRAMRGTDDLIPTRGCDVYGLHRADQEWIFSFADPQRAVDLLTRLINEENARLPPAGFSDPREWLYSHD